VTEDFQESDKPGVKKTVEPRPWH